MIIRNMLNKYNLFCYIKSLSVNFNVDVVIVANAVSSLSNLSFNLMFAFMLDT